MKKQKLATRANRQVRFHHQRGIEYYTNSKRTLRGFASLLLLAGTATLLVFAMPYASNYLGRNTSLQSQTPLTANTKLKAESSDVASSSKLPVQDKQLEKKIAAKLATFPKNQQWSVYVQDINSNRSASINADATYEPASFYKLFLLAPLESKFPADKWSTRIQGKSLKTCIDLMLRLSDNACGQAIGSLINWSYADSFNESIGFKKTQFSDGKGGSTTPREVGELFASLRKGEILSDKARRQIFDSLYAQKYASGIPAGCTECRVANKTGDINGFVHDGGIVTHGKESYVLVIMSKGGSFVQIADLTRAVESEMYP